MTGIFYQPLVTPEEADAVLIGFPWDGTVSDRPGTRFGPEAIRSATLGIEDYSPYQDRDIAKMKLSDEGDVELPIGDTVLCIDRIREEYRRIAGYGKKCMAFGGEHLVTWPLIEVMHERYGDRLFVIQLDAHADLRTDYLGVKYSHASVMNLITNLIGIENTAVVGIRSGSKDEWPILKRHPHYFGGAQGRLLAELAPWVREKLAGRAVYVTLDLDVFDPGIMPGTGTPEAGGISFADFTGFISALDGFDIVGADIVELAPDYDHSGVSSYLAGVALRELLLLMGEQS